MAAAPKPRPTAAEIADQVNAILQIETDLEEKRAIAKGAAEQERQVEVWLRNSGNDLGRMIRAAGVLGPSWRLVHRDEAGQQTVDSLFGIHRAEA